MSHFTGSYTSLLTAFAVLVSCGFLSYKYLVHAPHTDNPASSAQVDDSELSDEVSSTSANTETPVITSQMLDSRHQQLQAAQLDRLDQANQVDESGNENTQDAGALWDNNDRARRALEERQAQNNTDNQKLSAWKQKGVVGTKKAKSLARRDQRRAYYESVRQNAERERERIQLEEQMFGDLIAEEREERQRRIQEAKQWLDETNQKRRKEEEQERIQRNKRRGQLTSELQKRGIAALHSDMDIEIADDISKAIVLEKGDYAISLTENGLKAIAQQLKDSGRIEFSQIQRILSQSY